MDRSELKREAKQALKGRWGKAVGMVLLYEIIVGAISGGVGMIPIVGSLLSLILAIPLSFGFTGQILKFTRNEDVGICDYFKIGFTNFKKSWSIVGNIFLKMILYIVLYFVFGIGTGVAFGIASSSDNNKVMLISLAVLLTIVLVFLYVMLLVKSYLYVLSNYIGNDNLELSGKEIVEKSENIMYGHRWELFVLCFSFIGWILLSILTLGIGFLWLQPYMEVTLAKFYEHLYNSNNRENVIKKKNTGNIAVRIIASILVALMILPVCYTAVAYIVSYFVK